MIVCTAAKNKLTISFVMNSLNFSLRECELPLCKKTSNLVQKDLKISLYSEGENGKHFLHFVIELLFSNLF